MYRYSSLFNLCSSFYPFLFLTGSFGSVPAPCYHVHQVHSDFPASGAMLWSGGTSTEETSTETCSWWHHRQNPGAEKWDGPAGVLRVSLLWWCTVRFETHTSKCMINPAHVSRNGFLITELYIKNREVCFLLAFTYWYNTG